MSKKKIKPSAGVAVYDYRHDEQPDPPRPVTLAGDIKPKRAAALLVGRFGAAWCARLCRALAGMV